MPLLPFDVIVTVVRFFGIKEAIRFGIEARVLLRAFEYNPAVMEILNKQRSVMDMEVHYDEDKYEWTLNGTKALPLVKPPPTILGFSDISIGFSAESDTEVVFLFLACFLKFLFAQIWPIGSGRSGTNILNPKHAFHLT